MVSLMERGRHLLPPAREGSPRAVCSSPLAQHRNGIGARLDSTEDPWDYAVTRRRVRQAARSPHRRRRGLAMRGPFVHAAPDAPGQSWMWSREEMTFVRDSFRAVGGRREEDTTAGDAPAAPATRLAGYDAVLLAAGRAVRAEGARLAPRREQPNSHARSASPRRGVADGPVRAAVAGAEPLGLAQRRFGSW